jgi:hypothetical protein
MHEPPDLHTSDPTVVRIDRWTRARNYGIPPGTAHPGREAQGTMEYPPGWTCERTVLRLESYLLSTLIHIDALAVAEHLEACGECPHRLVLRAFRIDWRLDE